MTDVQCRSCRRVVSDDATVCPHCLEHPGKKPRLTKSQWIVLVAGAGQILAAGFMAIGVWQTRTALYITRDQLAITRHQLDLQLEPRVELQVSSDGLRLKNTGGAPAEEVVIELVYETLSTSTAGMVAPSHLNWLVAPRLDVEEERSIPLKAPTPLISNEGSNYCVVLRYSRLADGRDFRRRFWYVVQRDAKTGVLEPHGIPTAIASMTGSNFEFIGATESEILRNLGIGSFD